MNSYKTRRTPKRSIFISAIHLFTTRNLLDNVVGITATQQNFVGQ